MSRGETIWYRYRGISVELDRDINGEKRYMKVVIAKLGSRDDVAGSRKIGVRRSRALLETLEKRLCEP